jgi:AhpD family alkylhydroperoxidase
MLTFRTPSSALALSTLALALTAMSIATIHAADSVDAPRPVPLTRPEMKLLLEDMKGRTPRIPLPELSEVDKEKLGESASSYESRLRYHYLPAREARGAGRSGGSSTGRSDDPDMTLDYAFKVQLFWIVSRTNNCQYCLGHQEGKLLRAGMTEDEIAALDGDWSNHAPAQRAAYAFARRITFEPHRLSDEDIRGLRQHYTDKQILEMILSVAGNNSINRWKEGAGIPQSTGGGGSGNRRSAEGDASQPAGRSVGIPHSYVTPTSERFQHVITKVAPVTLDPLTGLPSKMTVCNRPALEPQAEVKSSLDVARRRTPRLPLVDEDQARMLVPEIFPDGVLPQWVRLFANFPTSAPGRIANIRAAEERGDLSPLLKAQLSWIIARQDRAWYAVGEAQHRLHQLGQSDGQIDSLDGDWKPFTPREQALFVVAKKLAASPVVLNDAEVTNAVKLAGPRDVVQTIEYTTSRAFFDRVTEAVGLPLD